MFISSLSIYTYTCIEFAFSKLISNVLAITISTIVFEGMLIWIQSTFYFAFVVFKCNICKNFVNNCVSATSDKDLAPYDSTISEPISGNNPFEKDTPPSG